MLLFVPLGDMFERRRLITGMCVLAACCAAAVAMAPNFVWLAIASLALGMASIVQHLILPFAAQLAPAGERGKAIGTVFTGMLLGILLARTVSGFIGGDFGWRTMYLIAAALMLVLALAVSSTFPKWKSVSNVSYPGLLRSLLTIVQSQPALRRLALIGAMLFGALNAFWVNSLFLVEMPPYHYGERAAGLLGLVGVVGALAAPIIGGRSDQRGARSALTIGLITALAGFIDLWIFRHVLWLVIAGVVLLDAGVQTGQVSNESRIYDLLPGAPSRVNTIYMTAYFSGGALGAAAGAYGWNAMHWDGVCIVGIGLLVIALAIHLRGGENIR
jgi:predicted MFS family arabinose efflux permease